MKNKFVEELNPYVPSERYLNKELNLHLDWNESDFEWPGIKNILSEFSNKDNLNKYPEINFLETLSLIKNYVGIDIDIDIFPGSDIAHEYILRAFTNPGEKILTINPGYSNFNVTAQSLGLDLKSISLEEKDFKEKDSLFKKICEYSEKIELIYLVNPHSPTGHVFSQEQMKILLKKFDKTFFILDEAYIDFCKEMSSSILIKEFSNLIITRSLSKAFSLAGSRIGFSLTNKENSMFLKKIINVKSFKNSSRLILNHVMSNFNLLKPHIEKINKNVVKTHEILKEKNISELNNFYSNFYFYLFNDPEERDVFFNNLLKNKILTRKINFEKGELSGLRITIPGNDLSIQELHKSLEKISK